MPTPRRYRLTRRTPDRALLEAFRSNWDVRVERRPPGRQRYLDTADWRAYRAGWVLLAGSRTTALADRETEQPLAALAKIPDWASDLPEQEPWSSLAAAVDDRRLIEQLACQVRESVVSLCDVEGKILARVTLCRRELRTGRSSRYVTVLPLRGYEKAAETAARVVEQAGGVLDDRPPVAALCAAAGLSLPGEPPGPAPDLDPDLPAAAAAGAVLQRLLEQMVATEGGVRQRLDDEFLHDYRVAGRRARSILKFVREVVPEQRARELASELAWLGTYTGPARDLDVHIAELGERPQGDDHLDPLRQHLRDLRDKAYRGLTATLDSERYRRVLIEWAAVASDSAAVKAGPLAGAVVSGWIRRAHRRVLRDGGAIAADTPAEALHDLRKRAKELRYLLECFATLYPADQRDPAVRELKSLQDNLGAFQDGQVQADALRALGDELLDSGAVPAATLLAMGRMVERLGESEQAARAAFAERFRRFSSPEATARFDRLVGRR